MCSLRNKKIIFELSLIPPLTGALISSATGLLNNRLMTPNIQEYLSLKEMISTVTLRKKIFPVGVNSIMTGEGFRRPD